jgi:hypothetical protein
LRFSLGLGVANRDVREHGDRVRHPLLEVSQTARTGDTFTSTLTPEEL